MSLIDLSRLLSFLLVGATMHVESATELQIKFTSHHQTIDSFGASDAWAINPLINKWLLLEQEEDIEELADILFSTETGIGLSGWRFNIGAGSFEQGVSSQIMLDNLGKPYRRAELLQASYQAEIDQNKQVGQIRFLQEAHERGVADLVAFSNSPPIWATKNSLAHPYNGQGVGSTNLDPEKTAEFADFLVTVLTYLRGEKVGVPVNYISPINEPTWDWQGKSQEGNRYNMDDAISVYNELYNGLQKAGLHHDVEIDAGEVVEYTAALSDNRYNIFSNNNSYDGGMNGNGQGLYRNYIDELLSDISFRSKIGNKISLHGYFSDIWLDRMGELRDSVYENVKEVSPDAKIWMSEFSILGGTGDARNFEGNGWDVNDMDYALHVAKVLHRDLTRLNVNAWHWWLGVTPYNYKDGLIKVNSELDAYSIRTSKVLWTLGHYSRFIRPGYKRVSLNNIDDLNGLMASAYKSPSDDKLVIVLANAGNEAESINFELMALPQGLMVSSFSTYVTNSENDLALSGLTNSNADYSIPAKSIVTFVADLVDVTSPPDVNFSLNRNRVEEGSTVTFTSAVINSPDTYLWSFPGGTPESSSDVNPTITYSEAGKFDVTLTATNEYGSDTQTLTDAIEVITANSTTCESEGYLNIEVWKNLSDTGDYNYDSSVASIPLENAAEKDTISVFEIESDVGDHYATRIKGYLCAPMTGEYTFWIASDNQGELWLSSDQSADNKSLIAHSSDWNDFREWNKYESQQSDAIYLIAGEKYYVETLHREYNGGDNLSVGWRLPDDSLDRPISQTYLSPFESTSLPIQTPDPVVPVPNESKSKSGGSMSVYMLLVLYIIRKRITHSQGIKNK